MGEKGKWKKDKEISRLRMAALKGTLVAGNKKKPAVVGEKERDRVHMRL